MAGTELGLTPPRARNAGHLLEGRPSWAIDIVIFTFLLGLVAGVVWFAQRSTTPLVRTVTIDLSLWALPGYSLLSLLRGLIAYACSLIFTVFYGTLCAKSRPAERILIPVLDVLQGIPVLGFLPGLVLGMISLFPGSNVGLEIACIVSIFTGQVWNMTFSFYGSLRAIPTNLIEVARVSRLTPWKRFTRLELPATAIGVVWNSMVSMAGGWFFLMVSEAFQLNNNDYRLPGIGAYMSVAYDAKNYRAIVAAIVAMGLVIVLTDQLLWRPLVAWSQKFKLEEQDAANAPTSWVLELIRRSKVLRRLDAKKPVAVEPGLKTTFTPPTRRTAAPHPKSEARVLAATGWFVVLVLAILSAYGAWRLLEKLATIDAHHWGIIVGALGLTTTRTIAALVLGTLWTVPVGVAIGLSPKIARAVLPFVQFIASFPAPMLFPLLAGFIIHRLHWNFAWASTILTLFGAQWYVLFNVIAGAMSIPTDLREVASVYRSSGLRIWRRLYLPGIFPHLLVGLITATGGAWNAAIVTEYQIVDGKLVTAPGLGQMISVATAAGDYATMAAAILALTVTLVLVNRVVWKRLYRWSDERFAFNR